MGIIKEMVYQDERICGIRLVDEIYKDHRYVIKTFGTHPTAYVMLNGNERMYQEALRLAHGDPDGISYDDFPIDCHGGLTYYSDRLPVEDDEYLPGNWIGWDYAHFDDQFGGFMFSSAYGNKKWTTKEIIKECKNVIDQIVGYEEGGSKMTNMDAEQRWIPVSERLPEKDGLYLVTNSRWGMPEREIECLMNGKWATGGVPIAWMPLPEPYKKDRMDDELTFTLKSPITDEQWDDIIDVDFEHTDRIWFETKHGKRVEFVKASAQPEQKVGKWISRENEVEE